jgi:hypothetical protein
VVGPIEEVPTKVGERFGDLVDRFSFYAPYRMEAAQLGEVLTQFKKI